MTPDRIASVSPGLVVALAAFAVYLVSGSRDLGTIDSGELAVVCARLGIAHPTGYPLYTLLGRLAVLTGASPIVACVVLSTVLCAAAVAVTAFAARELLNHLPDRPAPGGRTAIGLDLLAAASAGWLAFDRVFWDQAVGNEVYALHLLFVALLVLLGLRLMRRREERTLAALGLTGGLAFAHHLSIVFLAPAMVWALFGYARLALISRGGSAWRRGGAAWRRAAAILAVPAAIGWSVVLYLPIRSARAPILDWGSPGHWDEFWRHVFAAQYRVWLFESGRLWSAQLAGYVESLPERLTWPALAFALVGCAGLGRRPSALVFLGLVLVTTASWAASYNIHDLAPYFLPADLAIVLLAAAGAATLAGRLGPLLSRTRWSAPTRDGRAAVHLVAALVAATVAVQGLSHFRAATRKEDHFVRAHAEAVLSGLPPRAILFSRHWDALVSPALYLQEIEKLRPDVTLVDTELLRRSWYYPQLGRWDRALLKPLEDRVARLLEQLELFENGRPYNPAVIEQAYQDAIAGIATAHADTRPTTFTADVQLNLPAGGRTPISRGLVYEILSDPLAAPSLDPPDVDRLLRSGPRLDDPIHQQILAAWSNALTARIRFLEIFGRREEIAPWEEARSRIQPLLRQPG